MSLSEQYLEVEDLHPIDIVETLATHHDWDFDRVADDQIAMAIEGQWRTYSVTLAWSSYDETLNLTNDKCWAGAFSYWHAQRLMVYRYGLVLAGEQMASPDQIACMVETAVMAAERYYPAFQLACWGNKTPEQAMQVAIAQTYGRA